MEPKYIGETLKHLEKQNELLQNARDSMTNELSKLKVEEEMSMRKLYEVYTAPANKEGDNKRRIEDASSRSLVNIPSKRDYCRF